MVFKPSADPFSTVGFNLTPPTIVHGPSSIETDSLVKGSAEILPKQRLREGALRIYRVHFGHPAIASSAAIADSAII